VAVAVMMVVMVVVVVVVVVMMVVVAMSIGYGHAMCGAHLARGSIHPLLQCAVCPRNVRLRCVLVHAQRLVVIDLQRLLVRKLDLLQVSGHGSQWMVGP